MRSEEPTHWTESSCAWLYAEPGKEDRWFIAAGRLMREPAAFAEGYLELPLIAKWNAIVIACNTGYKRTAREQLYSCLDDPPRTRERLELLKSRDHNLIALLSTPEYYDWLNWDDERYLRDIRRTAELVGPACAALIGMVEVSKRFDSRRPEMRSGINRAIRDVYAGPIGVHEQSFEGVPVDDFGEIRGPTFSALQVGFAVPLRGDEWWANKEYGAPRPYDPSHIHAGATDWIKAEVTRMAHWTREGRFSEPHVVAVAEHSIPAVYEGQPWPPRPLPKARAYGQALLDAGAVFGLSGGARRWSNVRPTG